MKGVNEIVCVGLHSIEAPSERLRKLSLIRLLSRASMRRLGQLHPLLVRPNPKRPGSYRLTTGHHRLVAAKQLRWSP